MLAILVVNVGSTSLKFKLIAFEPPDLQSPRATLAEGRIEGIGQDESPYKITASGRTTQAKARLPGYDDALNLLLATLDADGSGLAAINAICFKPVHARDVPLEIVEMDEDILGRMAEFNALAPSHNPPVIAAVRSFRAIAPTRPLLGLFEPAFHSTIPAHAYTESVPLKWLEDFGIRKYGFHGASHRHIAERAPVVLGRPSKGLRIVSCHLGGSSSITAILDGKSLDTTMAFSPQSGLPQGTRCGSIDPFIPFFLIQSKGWSAEQVARSLGKESGLLGLSGVSAEYRDIEAAAREGNLRAARTLEIFAYQIQGSIARMTAPLRGIDALVFTGGIGERGASLRAAVCSGLGYLGLELDPQKNSACSGSESALQTATSPAAILVIPANEELVLAREAAKFLLTARQ